MKKRCILETKGKGNIERTLGAKKSEAKGMKLKGREIEKRHNVKSEGKGNMEGG